MSSIVGVGVVFEWGHPSPIAKIEKVKFYLLAGHGEHSTQDALLQAGAQDNRVVFLIHGDAELTCKM